MDIFSRRESPFSVIMKGTINKKKTFHLLCLFVCKVNVNTFYLFRK